MDVGHRSDCAVLDETTHPTGRCNCGALEGTVGNLIKEHIANSPAYDPDLAKEIIKLVREQDKGTI